MAKRFSGRVAVRWKSGELTYDELDSESNRVATHLLACGVGAGDVVGLALPRSPEMVAGILGILKCGAAYVPLDPEARDGRDGALFQALGGRVRLVSDCDAREGGISGISGITDLVVGAGGRKTETTMPPSGAEGLSGDGGRIFYVMWTSGSTGKPKAVGVPERAVSRLVRGGDFAEMGPEHTWLQMAPLGFDASTLEIWAALCHGGCLALMPPGVHSVDEIGAAIRELGVTSAWMTAGLFRVVVDEGLDALAPLRQLLTGGDVVPVAQARKVIERFPKLRLINGYGPTENTTFTCCHRITREDCEGEALPIGRAIEGTSVCVLDEELRVCATGEIGELCASGEGLASGYLNDPELTAEKFIEHPEFGRIYRTGDLARIRADGVCEFHGRRDAQVKIRGFRVEPGELEAMLMRSDLVQEATVVVAREPSREARLIACVSPLATDIEALRIFLEERVPGYLLPSEIRGFSQLPLTANGKVDRRRLLVEVSRTETTATTHPADSCMESFVRGVWEEVLGSRGYEADAGFFACGGDSISVLQLHSRLNRNAKHPLSVAELFEFSTIRRQAQRLTSAPERAAVGERAAMQRAALARKREQRK